MYKIEETGRLAVPGQSGFHGCRCLILPLYVPTRLFTCTVMMTMGVAKRVRSGQDENHIASFEQEGTVRALRYKKKRAVKTVSSPRSQSLHFQSSTGDHKRDRRASRQFATTVCWLTRTVRTWVSGLRRKEQS